MLCEDGGDMVDILYLVFLWLIWLMFIGKWIIEGIEICVQLLDFDGLLCQFFDFYIMVCEVYFQCYDFIVNGGKFKLQENLNVQVIQDEFKEIDLE